MSGVEGGEEGHGAGHQHGENIGNAGVDGSSSLAGPKTKRKMFLHEMWMGDNGRIMT